MRCPSQEVRRRVKKEAAAPPTNTLVSSVALRQPTLTPSCGASTNTTGLVF